MSKFVFTGGYAWPNPADPSGVKEGLRRGDPLSESDYGLAVAYITAYQKLIGLPRRERNEQIKKLKAALKRMPS